MNNTQNHAFNINIENAFFRLFDFLKKNRKVLLTGLSIGILLFVVSLFLVKTKYIFRMSLTSSVVSGFKLKSILKPVEDMVSGDDDQRLAKELDIPIESAKSFKDIDVKIEYDNRIYPSEYIDLTDHFREIVCIIQIKTTDSLQSNVKIIEQSLIKYLENNSFISSTINAHREANLKNGKTVYTEIGGLDSLKKVTIRKLEKNSHEQIMMVNDLSSLNRSIVDLYRLKNRLDEINVIYDKGINVISNLIFYKKDTIDKIIKSLLLIILSVIVSVIIIYVKQLISKYKNLHHNS